MRRVDTAAGQTGSGSLDRLASACLRIAESSRFQTTVIIAILLNALVIGLETCGALDELERALVDGAGAPGTPARPPDG
jgi:hypothetical protein